MRVIRLFKRDLAAECRDWVDQDFISQDQAQTICDYYGADLNGDPSGLRYQILIGLGYLFLALSLITLIGHNWEEIPRAVRASGLILATALVQGFGLYRFHQGSTESARSIFFLGNFVFGAAIILIAQTYHLGEHMPDGIFWWALGSLAFAALCQSRLLTLQTLSLALIWFWVEADLGFYPAAMPVFLTLGLWALYKTDTSKTLLLLCLTGLTLWLEYSLAFWLGGRNFDVSEELLIVGGAWLLLLANAGRYLQALNDHRAKEYGLLLELWCLRLGLIGLLILGFEDPWEGLISADWYHLAPMLFITLIFASASLWLAIKGGIISWTISVQGIFLLSLTLVVVSHDRELAVLLQVTYNLLAVVLGIWLIHRALSQGISHYFFLGIALILLTALLRYADLIGDYIGGAVLFAVCAGLLIGSAKFWRQQQHQLKSESL